MDEFLSDKKDDHWVKLQRKVQPHNILQLTFMTRHLPAGLMVTLTVKTSRCTSKILKKGSKVV